MTGADVLDVVRRALAEDLGTGDVTTEATVAPDARARAEVVQKEAGVIFGLDPAEAAFRELDPAAEVRRLAPEGRWRDPGPVLEVEGAARALLSAERTALNLLARLSGVATLTARCVATVEGTGVKILDTRKTTPGLRALEKGAVRAGGGVNHRVGLYDAVLIKENHIALAGGVGKAVRRALEHAPDLPLTVECRTLEEVDEALAAGATHLLLDNMDLDALAAAAERTGERAQLEASGGMSLERLGQVARTGVHFISVGALTHSAPALDVSLLLSPSP